MGNTPPLSLSMLLGKIRAAGRKLASLSTVQGLMRIFPGLPLAALACLVIMFFVWSCEHQARQRDLEAAKQVKKQADEEIFLLQQRAAGALRDARQSTQAARELEAQRQKLVREAEGLRQSLESLRQKELAHINEVATLPTSDVVSRVASRLQEQVSGNREQGTGPQPDLLTRPAPVDESAGAGHPLPQGGEGKNNSGGEGRNNPTPGVRDQGSGPAANASRASTPALVLTDQGARKVETALIELDSCRQQAQVMGQQVANCEQRAKLDSALQQQQSGTIAKLHAALADKDQILARREAAHRAEVKAARGTWRSRFFHAVEIFAGGFIAGVLVR